MFRRLIAVAALTSTVLVSAPSLANADSSGAIAGGPLVTAMGTLSSGDAHTCNVTASSNLVCWGRNQNGQVGNGTTSDALLGDIISGITTATAVSAGGLHTCVLLADTTVKCWGNNSYGQVGNGSGSAPWDITSPTTVCDTSGCGSPLSGVTQLALGGYFSCALKSTGAVLCWGNNIFNQLGVSSPGTSNLPLVVTGVTGATSIAAGDSHACAIVASGAVKCWGADSRGQLGDGSTTDSTPVSVTRTGATSGVKALALGGSHTCVINSSSNVLCWGDNNYDQMGYQLDSDNPNGSYVYDNTIHNTPHTVTISGSAMTAKAITSGTYASCAISSADTLYCWGGLHDKGGSGSPWVGPHLLNVFGFGQVSGLSAVTSVSIGEGFVCATTTRIKCWGFGWKGQLGNFGATDSVATLVNAIIPVMRVVTFGALANKTTASAPFAVSATVDVGESPVEYSSTTGSVCTVGSNTGIVTLLTAGTCTIAADAPGYQSMSGDFYASANTVTRSFTVTNVAPSATIAAATAVTTSGATLNATVNAAQLSTTTRFLYSRSADLSNSSTAVSTTVTGQSDTSVSSTITGLSPGVTYYFQVAATNSIGETKSSSRSFTTLGAVPVVTSGSPTSVSSGRATLNGVVNANDLPTSVWFTIGQKSDLSDGTKIDFREITGNTSTDVSVSALNLTESVRYYYRIEASNSLGSVKGDIKSFTAARPTGISVNDAAEFTNKKSVTIYATGPSGATQVIISNDGGFGSAQTFSLTDNYAEIPWTLVASRDERLPKTVYARFVQRFGTQSANYSDDIILDTTAPTMTGASGTSTSTSSDNVTVQGVRITAAKGAVKLTVKASDANSGIGKVQVKGSSGGSPVDVATGSPKATSRTIKVNTTKKKLWVRVVDRAGNVSKWVTVTVK